MYFTLRFTFGLFLGSFLNVLALRYEEDKFIFSKKSLGGRSHCPHCGKTLSWHELIPLLSFVFQLGKCRSCKHKLSLQYPIAEIISGFILGLTPLRLHYLSLQSSLFNTIIWVLIFYIFLLITLIDLRLHIIPDELNICLALCGILLILFSVPADQPFFLKPFDSLFGFQSNIWLNRILGGVFGLLFFGAIVLLTRGRGMGIGDVKMAAAMGLVFGWGGTILFTVMSFVLGALVGIFTIALKKGSLKSLLPFGPFLSLSAAVVFFAGNIVLYNYLGLLGFFGLKLF